MKLKLSVLTVLTLLFCQTAWAQLKPVPAAGIEAPAVLQLRGYNNRDIETFLKAYSDTVKVYNQPGQFAYQGKNEMRKRYASMFANTPDLHCELVNRIISGNVVIDHERVQFSKNNSRREAIAIYRIKDNLIYEVTFISPQ
ncbi:nuclear transport factor 2 family protein [Pontibacter harenae]|uniref:nuclear transport factor 2 family protein n=1 Tax=Pontibacter harenae TaxID=2894083 RepID=UPI001E32812F|nr:nuclear transport factor 2 family protein [Pontibacter harenae]MCC9165733.1 nuclear transport factor 2 family protein [Pontibacter harenae]